MRIIITSSIVDFWTTSENSSGLKLYGNTDTLTESSILIGELYKKVKYKTSKISEKLQISLSLNKWNFRAKF